MLSFWSSDYASRNTSEPGTSLRNTAVVNLPKMAKPETYWEENGKTHQYGCTEQDGMARIMRETHEHGIP